MLQLREVPGLAERMGSLMCVDVDVDDDEDEGNCELGVEETLESEVGEAKEKGDGTLRWLELEGLNIDDAMLVSLALPTRFPVSNPLTLVLRLISFHSFPLCQRLISFYFNASDYSNCMIINKLFKGKKLSTEL